MAFCMCFLCLLAILQSDNPGAALASDVAVQRVARVDDERRERTDALVVDVAVVGDDDHAISGLKLFVRQRHGLQRFAAGSVCASSKRTSATNGSW